MVVCVLILWIRVVRLWLWGMWNWNFCSLMFVCLFCVVVLVSSGVMFSVSFRCLL